LRLLIAKQQLFNVGKFALYTFLNVHDSFTCCG
jgi:hypothetical protein